MDIILLSIVGISFSVDDCTKWTKCLLYKEKEFKGNIITWPIQVSTTGSGGTNVESTLATTSSNSTSTTTNTTSSSTDVGSSNTTGSQTSIDGTTNSTSTDISTNTTGQETTRAAFRQRPTELAKIKVDTMPVNDFCEYKALTIMMLPSKRTFEESILACKQLKSTIYTYKDSVSKQLPEAPMESWSDCIWTGHTRNSNGQFIARYDGNSSIDQTKLNWMWGEPNGDDLQECSTLHGKTNIFFVIFILNL